MTSLDRADGPRDPEGQGEVAPPRLALTLGDPAGIGPEIVAAVLRSWDARAATLVVVGDPRAMAAAGIVARPGVALHPVDSGFRPDVDPLGAPSAASGRAAAITLLSAIDLALSFEVDGVVTAPTSKDAMYQAGYHWPGQTEVLIERAGVDAGVMLFVGGGLKVALATRHLALRDVPAALKTSDIARDLVILDATLRRDFGISGPRIGVCGLNPHAGEAGRFGDEEARIIAPAIAAAVRAGATVLGPAPADTLFVRHQRGEVDAVLAMYHDQGLIPVKLLGFGEGVNMTAGLPFIRTSPDHGTAYDIAGRGVADPSSLQAALLLAIEAVQHRRGSLAAPASGGVRPPAGGNPVGRIPLDTTRGGDGAGGDGPTGGAEATQAGAGP